MDRKEELLQLLVDEGYLKTPHIIDAFRAVDRRDFVLSEYQNEAYGNYPLPVGEGQTISQPLTVAFMLELLEPKPGEIILDVGAGSGWQTALLAHIVGPKGKVLGVERLRTLCEFAKENLKKYNFLETGSAEILCLDATAEIPPGPYDKIIAAAAASRDIPESWKKVLKIGGKIVAPIRGSIWLFIKKSATGWEEKEYPGFVFVPLVKGGNKTNGVGGNDSIPPNTIKKKPYRTIAYWLLAIGLATAIFVNEIYRPHTSFTSAETVDIPPGLGSRQIGNILKQTGVIRSKWLFVFYASLTNKASSLKPGTYVFFNTATIPGVIRDLVLGGTNEIAITIPEGWSLKETAEYLERNKIITAKSFLQLTTVKHSMFDSFDFLKDKPSNAGLEGYLFPDTYRIFKDANVEDIVTKMLENFDRKLTPDLRAEIAKRSITIFDMVRMASLIEKEVISDEDRALVSGILWKRLEAGIGLQVDATITFIKNQELGITNQENKKISIADTQINSLYNTYKYRGLPKGPVSNPGLSAIRAAIYPRESPYLYYLSAPDGRTIFSRTLEDHNIAKTKYLK